MKRLSLVLTNSKVVLRGCINLLPGKAGLKFKCSRNLKKKLRGTRHLNSKIIDQEYLLKALKYKALYCVPFQIEA